MNAIIDNSSGTSENTALDLSFDNDERKWQSIIQRNPVANGAFVYGVISTKIFCRPICPARLPRRSNVVFFSNPNDAASAGFRSCMRCHPESDSSSLASTRATKIAKACRSIERNGKVSLDDLANESNLSKFHFQRIFKSVMGITPQQYKMAYQHSQKQKSAGRVVFAIGPCYLGHILVAVSERGICAIDLGDDPDTLIASIQHRFPSAEMSANNPEFNALVSILGGTAESSRILEWELPLDIQGTAFQHRVWNSLREIPWGNSRTYSDIARQIGSPAAIRAVARACAANPLAIAIPCHRIIRADGTPSGYKWGLEKKVALLQMEKKATDNEGLREFRGWVESCMQ
jgi:AraC family transcriptional regulator, regulatory protein of adaptative response / methylated-DNA-[protein]-cysteine methyltransferase